MVMSDDLGKLTGHIINEYLISINYARKMCENHPDYGSRFVLGKEDNGQIVYYQPSLDRPLIWNDSPYWISSLFLINQGWQLYVYSEDGNHIAEYTMPFEYMNLLGIKLKEEIENKLNVILRGYNDRLERFITLLSKSYIQVNPKYYSMLRLVMKEYKVDTKIIGGDLCHKIISKL